MAKTPGSGRQRGTPNVATANARQAIANFIDGNAHRLQGWLDDIAKSKGPQAAFDCFKDLVEYHVPKLGRTELTGDGGKAVEVYVVCFSDPTTQQLGTPLLSDARLAGARTGLPPRSIGVAPKIR